MAIFITSREAKELKKLIELLEKSNLASKDILRVKERLIKYLKFDE